MECGIVYECKNLPRMPKKIESGVQSPNSRSILKKKIRKTYQLSALYSKYFYLAGENDSGKVWLGSQAAAKCCLCPNNYIQFTAGTTSNLRKHLKRKHPGALNEIEEEKANRRINQNPEKNTMKTSFTVLGKRQAKQCITLTSTTDPKQSKGVVDSPSSFLDSLATFIIETLQPVSIINEPSFGNLLGLSSSSYKQCFDIWTVFDVVNKRYESMMERLNSELALISYVCVTADVWNSGKTSLIVVTAHWLKPELCRRSAALACIGVRGSISLEEVAHHLGNVITKCEMHKKLTGNLTINITNFSKAFDICPQNYEEDSDDELDDIEEQGVATILPTESLTPENEVVNLYFPNHYHCLSRLLIVIASKDIKPALELQLTSELACTALNKGIDLWNKLSIVKTESATENNDKNIKLPFTVKWNHYYRAVSCVNNLIRTNPDALICSELDKSIMQPDEITFLQEFELVLKPLVMASNHLNGEPEILLAHVLPTINGLKRKLTNLRDSLGHCEHLVNEILENIEKRFGECYKDSSLIIASCTHPSFRLRWIPESERSYAVSVLENVLAALDQTGSQSQVTDYAAEMEDFYGLECVAQSKTELQRFLEDSRTELESLDCYPAVKEIFRRYNTTIANRTPIDNLFKGDNNIFTRITKDGAKSFEMQLLLRANKHI